MYDVAIVGAGPAGATAAVAAARTGASVLLIDRQAFPRDKTCGDGIAWQALDFLAGLGVSDVDADFPGLSALRLTGPDGAEVARPMAHQVKVIPRAVFDARLVGAALRAGAIPLRHNVRHVETRADRIVLDRDVEARVVIGADGAASAVRRHLGYGPNPDGHLALAIRGYAPHPPGTPLEQRIVMARRRWPAYAWSFPIGDGRRNVGYGELLANQPLTRGYLLDRVAALLPDVDLGTVTGIRAHHLPLSTRRPPPGRGRVLLAGDALSLINPFTGEGIFYAVVSGGLAGAAAVGGDSTDAARRYRQALRRRLHRHLRHTGILARLTRYPWIVNAGMRAGAADQAVFDALVALGLGDGLMTARVLARTAAEAAKAMLRPGPEPVRRK